MAITMPKQYERGMNRRQFLTIPIWVEYECGLTHPHDRVYAFLYSIQESKIKEGIQDPWVIVDQTYIGLFCGLKRQHVNKIVKELVNAGWLIKDLVMKDKQILHARYKVVLPPTLEHPQIVENSTNVLFNEEKGVATVGDRGSNCRRQGVATVGDKGVATVGDNNKVILETKTETKTKTTTATTTLRTDRLKETTTPLEPSKPSSSGIKFNEKVYKDFIAGVEKLRENSEFSTKAAYIKALEEGYTPEELRHAMDIFVKKYQEPYSDRFKKNTRKFFEEGHYTKGKPPYKKGNGYDPLNPSPVKRLTPSQQKAKEAARKIERYGKKGELICPKCGGNHPNLTKGAALFLCSDCNAASDYQAWKINKPVVAGEHHTEKTIG